MLLPDLWVRPGPYTRVSHLAREGFSLTRKYETGLERPATNKNSSLLHPFSNYEESEYSPSYAIILLILVTAYTREAPFRCSTLGLGSGLYPQTLDLAGKAYYGQSHIMDIKSFMTLGPDSSAFLVTLSP